MAESRFCSCRVGCKKWKVNYFKVESQFQATEGNSLSSKIKGTPLL